MHQINDTLIDCQQQNKEIFEASQRAILEMQDAMDEQEKNMLEGAMQYQKVLLPLSLCMAAPLLYMYVCVCVCIFALQDMLEMETAMNADIEALKGKLKEAQNAPAAEKDTRRLSVGTSISAVIASNRLRNTPKRRATEVNIPRLLKVSTSHTAVCKTVSRLQKNLNNIRKRSIAIPDIIEVEAESGPEDGGPAGPGAGLAGGAPGAALHGAHGNHLGGSNSAAENGLHKIPNENGTHGSSGGTGAHSRIGGTNIMSEKGLHGIPNGNGTHGSPGGNGAHGSRIGGSNSAGENGPHGSNGAYGSPRDTLRKGSMYRTISSKDQGDRETSNTGGKRRPRRDTVWANKDAVTQTPKAWEMGSNNSGGGDGIDPSDGAGENATGGNATGDKSNGGSKAVESSKGGVGGGGSESGLGKAGGNISSKVKKGKSKNGVKKKAPKFVPSAYWVRHPLLYPSKVLFF